MKKDLETSVEAFDFSHDSEMSRRVFLKMSALAGTALSTGLLVGGAAEAGVNLKGRQMVFASWGGSYQDAQRVSYCEPFTKATGAEVIQDGPMNGGKLRTMVEAGAPIWDVVDVTDIFLFANESRNLFEKIDTSIVKTDHVDPSFVHSQGIGCIVWSYNVGYSTKAFPGDNHPRTWADVFDTKKFPGKRMLRDRVYPTLEQALLADGVAPKDLYPLDVDRAFKKLDTIKDDVVWWKSNSQSQQLLSDGAVSCGLILNGRAYDLVKKGADVNISWDQVIISADYFAIPKGAKNAEVAQHFMNYMTSAENQATMANTIAYAPVNPDAFGGINEEVKPWLSTNPENASKGFVINAAYWRDNLDALAERWNEWKLS